MLSEIYCEHIYAFHPSSYLDEYLKDEKISKKDFLERNNNLKEFADFMECKINVTPELAEKLSKATNITISTWLNLQKQFDSDLEEIMKRRKKTLASITPSNVIDIANYIINKYKERVEEDEIIFINCKSNIEPMKLQKLIYFTQRECLSLTENIAFKESLEGWEYGPVSSIVYNAYKNNKLKTKEKIKDISDGLKYIIDNVIEGYGFWNSFKLSQISHKEISWINARKGLEPKDKGKTPLKIEDIRIDAGNYRPFDYKLGVYYDDKEFFEKFQ